MDNQTTYYIFENETYTDYNYTDYTFKAGTDALYATDMYKTIKKMRLILYFLLVAFVIGLVGNSLTIFVILSKKSMRTVTNYYLLNLSVADLTILANGVARLIAKYYIGTYQLCHYFYLIEFTSVYASTLTITIITIERYLAICKPFKTPPTTSRIVTSIILIWTIAVLAAYYLLTYMQCHEAWPGSVIRVQGVFVLYHVYAVVFCFLPMILMVILYTLMGMRLIKCSKIQKHVGKGKRQSDAELKAIDPPTRRTLKMLIAIVVVFFTSWTTYFINDMFTIYIYVFLRLRLSYVVLYFKIIFITNYVQIFIFLFSLVINPVIYSIMSKKFRDAFKEVLYKLCRRRQRKVM